MHWALFKSIFRQPYAGFTFSSPIVQVKKLRHGEVKALSQGPRPPVMFNWKSRDLKPEVWIPDPTLFTSLWINGSLL